MYTKLGYSSVTYAHGESFCISRNVDINYQNIARKNGNGKVYV